MGIEVPEAHGGAGGSFFHAVLAIEELSRVDPAVGVLVDVHNTLVVNALRRWGTAGQQAALAAPPRAPTVGAYALSEPEAGSDAFALATRGPSRRRRFRLSGRKVWITNGKEAGLFVVFATVDPAAGYKGITAFLVSAASPGFTVGRKEDKLGIRASSTCELIFDGARVAKADVLGEVGKGYKVAIETLNEGGDRHRRADARPGAGRARARDRTTSDPGASSARRSPTSGRPVPARSRRDRARGGAAPVVQRARACATRAGHSSARRRCARLRVGRRRARHVVSPCSSPRAGATATPRLHPRGLKENYGDAGDLGPGCKRERERERERSSR